MRALRARERDQHRTWPSSCGWLRSNAEIERKRGVRAAAHKFRCAQIATYWDRGARLATMTTSSTPRSRNVSESYVRIKL